MSPSACDRCTHNLCARKVTIFASLSDSDLRKIIMLTNHRDFEKGEVLFLEGSSSDTLYILNEGQVKLSKITKDGKEQILRILSPGDFFGELSLFGNRNTTNFAAVSISDTRICTLTKRRLDVILKEKPEIALEILATLADRLAETENLAQNLATQDVEARIAYILLEFSEKYGTAVNGTLHFKIPITREEMANYAGITRETMSRKLRMLEAKGILSFQGPRLITIRNEGFLRSLLY